MVYICFQNGLYLFIPLNDHLQMGTHHFQTRQYVYLVDRSSFCRVKQSCFSPPTYHLCKPCFLRLRQEHTGNQNMIVRIQRKQDSATLMSLIFDCLVPLFPHFPLTPQCSVCPVCLGHSKLPQLQLLLLQLPQKLLPTAISLWQTNKACFPPKKKQNGSPWECSFSMI